MPRHPVLPGQLDHRGQIAVFVLVAREGADVVGGCGGGNYCPADAVTRAQMGVFIGATFGLTLYGP